MSDFLLELRSEEIPARMQAGARADLEKLFRAEMTAAGVAVGEVTVWSTPRRLALIARGLPEMTEAVHEEVKGPRTVAPPQALEGFLRKTGLTLEDLTERDGVWFAITEKPGRAVKGVLAEAIPAIIRAFPWPKSQRWGAASISTESLRWVRPLSGIVALFGGEVVECTLDVGHLYANDSGDIRITLEKTGLRSGRSTMGHRFHSHGPIEIPGVDEYAALLRSHHVIVDQGEREHEIRAGAARAAHEAGLVLVEDEGLVIENAGLTEWPVPLLGRFDEAYLDVPPEVIQLTARTNQKYFICRTKEGALANAFICTANIRALDGGAAIVDGNRKVLAARLSDARFFWEQDRKVPLEEQAKKLERITFHEKLGTVADKVERVAKLARWLVEEGIVTSQSRHSRESGNPAQLQDSGTPASAGVTKEELAEMAEQAARLCKADLVTEMVGEFPELQGLMGGYYARAEGLPDAVADAIRDHYKPVGQGDEVPTAPVTVAVSLADKLDTLVSFFAIGLRPTGSKDPFALRRQALAAIEMFEKNGLRAHLSLCLRQVVEFAIAHLLAKVSERDAGVRKFVAPRLEQEEHPLEILVNLLAPKGENKLSDAYLDALVAQLESTSETRRDLRYAVEFGRGFRQGPAETLQFIIDRLKVQQREAGVRHDLIDAVFALGGEDDLVRLLARVHALQSFIGSEDGANLLAGYKRAANILKKEEWEAGEPKALSYTPEPAEKALIDALAAAGPKADAAIAAEDFEGAMAALASLRAPIDTFFDEVTVNAEEREKRAARLDLLAQFRAAVHKVADFSKIEG